MKRTVLLLYFIANCLVAKTTLAQLIRKDEVDKITGKRVIRTETIALTKGLIYNFISSGDDKYIQVRIQKHGHFEVAENDTLVFNMEDSSLVRAVASRGGQGNIPFRPKSPGILSLWSLFKISDTDFNKFLSLKVVSAYVKPHDIVMSYNEQLIFPKIKRQPAELLMERAHALVEAEKVGK